jgi:hypothetical protein
MKRASPSRARFLGGDRPREIIALEMRCMPASAERLELRFGLDALGDHFQPQRAAEMDDRMDDRGAFALAAHAVDEAAVDLQAIEREACGYCRGDE